MAPVLFFSGLGGGVGGGMGAVEEDEKIGSEVLRLELDREVVDVV